MKKYLITLAFFIAFLKVVDFGIYQSLLYAERNFAGKIDTYGYLFSGQINADICFFGSSQTQCHINPEIIQKATGKRTWNLGVGGTNFEQHFFTLKNYLKLNKKPEIIFFEADEYSMDTSYLDFNKAQFKAFRGYSPLVDDLLDKEETGFLNLIRTHYFKSITFQGRVYSILQSTLSYLLGHTPISAVDRKQIVSDNPLIESFNGSYLIDIQLDSLTFEEESIQISSVRKTGYIALKDYAENENLNIILLHPPQPKGHIAATIDVSIRNFYDSVANQSANITYWDFSKNEDLEDISFFSDEHHLNLEGANIYTEKIQLAIANLKNQ